MNKTRVIALNELFGLSRSPAVYLILFLVFTVFNAFFFIIVEQNREASLRDVFRVIEFLLMFIVPILTMRTFAEEKRSGTMEFLMTTPTSNAAIVWGKFLGAFGFYTLLLLLASQYYLLMEFFSAPDRGEAFSGYLGLWLEGSFFIAVGIMTSSWFRSQSLAALCSYVILLSLFFSISFIEHLSGLPEALVRTAAFWSHSENFFSGLITVQDVVYFVSVTLFCLAVTRLSLENRSL